MTTEISELCSFGDGNETEKVKIIKEIIFERIRQYELHGEDDHTPFEWLPILVGEIGEVSDAIKNDYFGSDKEYGDYRTELIQVAAVAISMIECFDRKEEK